MINLLPERYTSGPGSEARIGKTNVRLAGAVGFVYGTTFALDGCELAIHHGHGDGASVSRDACGGEAAAAAAAASDNRDLRDDTDNQGLGHDDIRELKAAGVSAKVGGCGSCRVLV